MQSKKSAATDRVRGEIARCLIVDALLYIRLSVRVSAEPAPAGLDRMLWPGGIPVPDAIGRIK